MRAGKGGLIIALHLAVIAALFAAHQSESCIG